MQLLQENLARPAGLTRCVHAARPSGRSAVQIGNPCRFVERRPSALTGPAINQQSLWDRWIMARPAGLEPATTGLEGQCSIQLSYGRSQLLIDTPKYRLVGADGFEPPTLCSQSRCATRLRHAPMPSRYIVASSVRTAEAGPGGGTIIRPPPGPVNLPVPFFCLKSGT